EIDCVIHPQSVIHSMVEFLDSSVICQMSNPNMEIPIQYALSYPDRFITNVESLNFEKIKSLEFFKIDKKKFPCYNLAIRALSENAELILNAANEAAVNAYLESKINFLDIANVVEYSLNKFHNIKADSLSDILYYDKEVNDFASGYIDKL
ncbi:MAG: 1-deoxy-D-xylulose-5-phosphate reductoisomerase, partial [Firmicutes bacterium]|nr:1-deoxy-D-xylulose-5-phosphate reductoisomerase [Bacillota bacterium]